MRPAGGDETEERPKELGSLLRNTSCEVDSWTTRPRWYSFDHGAMRRSLRAYISAPRGRFYTEQIIAMCRV